jgi:hypothetical protein
MNNNYAVIENEIVVNVALSAESYAISQGWVLLPNGFGIGDFYVNNVFVRAPQPQPSPEDIQAENKSLATQYLQETDWTCTIDISNPQYSNPYLINQDDFLAYRSQVRNIAVNPPTTLAIFPIKPDEVWSS